MELVTWLNAHGGVARRAEAFAAGYSRSACAAVTSVRRSWLVSPQADRRLVAAAATGGRLACVSAAEMLGLAVLERPARLHIAVRPDAHASGTPNRLHWNQPIREAPGLIESLPDVLGHVADCLPRREALVVWESALRRRLITLHECRRTTWPHLAARRIAAEVSDLADSPLETLLAMGLRDRGLLYRQQVPLLGSPVDFVVGRGLVVQTDGFEFHRSSAQRGRDLDHDAKLLLAGRNVLRFDYPDVVHGLESTVAIIERAEALM